MFRKLGFTASTAGGFWSSCRKKSCFVPKKVIPIHAVTRLVLSFSTFLRSAFHSCKLQSMESCLATTTHRFDDDTSGTVAYEEDGPCFRL